jgi:hypothetical protein
MKTASQLRKTASQWRKSGHHWEKSVSGNINLNEFDVADRFINNNATISNYK